MRERSEAKKKCVLAVERAARNESIFRDANERLRQAAESLGADVVPFICECSETGCTELVQLTLEEYRGIRTHPRRFATAPGHESEVDGKCRLVDASERFEVIEKLGPGGDVAEELAANR